MTVSRSAGSHRADSHHAGTELETVTATGGEHTDRVALVSFLGSMSSGGLDDWGGWTNSGQKCWQRSRLLPLTDAGKRIKWV